MNEKPSYAELLKEGMKKKVEEEKGGMANEEEIQEELDRVDLIEEEKREWLEVDWISWAYLCFAFVNKKMSDCPFWKSASGTDSLVRVWEEWKQWKIEQAWLYNQHEYYLPTLSLTFKWEIRFKIVQIINKKMLN